MSAAVEVQVIQPDVNGEFPTPADGAIWMLETYGISQTPLRGKAPFLTGWQKSENTLKTAEAIRAAAAKYSGCNFGSVFNEDVFAFEADIPAKGEKNVRTRFEEAGGTFSSQLIIQSSKDGSKVKGHRYYSYIDGIQNISQGHTKYGDFSVRVKGEQCVSPGSIHPTTHQQYRVVGIGPLDPPTPEEIMFWNSENVSEHASAKPAKNTETTQTQQKVQHGQIHTWLCSTAGTFRAKGMTPEAIEPVLIALAHEMCEEPIDDKRVAQVARSMGNYVPNDPRLKHLTSKDLLEAADAARQLALSKGDDFMTKDIKPRSVFIKTVDTGEPVIFGQSINQIFAWRGLGKTCLGLGFVRCLATGEPFLNFQCDEPVDVLYVEGELPASQMQERWRTIVGNTNGHAYLATIDEQPDNYYTSLATEVGKKKIEDAIASLKTQGVDITVLFLDNISTLFNVVANEEEAWVDIQPWFISLRSRGITVIFFHHAGKGGLSRSHSKSEDSLDVSIQLERPKNQATGYLHAVLSFDKSRHGLSMKPAEISLHRIHSENCACKKNGSLVIACPGDGSRWECAVVENKRADAEQMFVEGKSPKLVSEKLSVAVGTVKRWRTEWGKKDKASSNSVEAKEE